MKVVKTLLLAFVLCFSLLGRALPETTIPSVYDSLQKLENDLKNGKPKTVIISDLSLVKEAKKNLPVSFVPELNYLVGTEVEKVPTTEITLMKKLLYYLYPVEAALNVFLFVLLFYTLVFYVQSLSVSPFIKKFATIISVTFLAFSFIVYYPPLVYAVTAFGFILLFLLKKKRLAIYSLAALLFLLTLQTINENLSSRLKSEKFFYSVKVKRDGYAPDYLIDRVFSEKKDSLLEKVTSHLALGDLNSISLLKQLEFQNPFRKAVVLNDYGYVSFLKGDYARALQFFESSLKTYPLPEVEYNLYLTYSSLLNLEKAKILKEKLLEKGIEVEKLPPVPVLVHLPAPDLEYTFPFRLLLGFALGTLAGIVFSHFFVATPGNFDPELLLIPGMRAFINSSVKHIILLSGLILIVNAILGRIICSV